MHIPKIRALTRAGDMELPWIGALNSYPRMQAGSSDKKLPAPGYMGDLLCAAGTDCPTLTPSIGFLLPSIVNIHSRCVVFLLPVFSPAWHLELPSLRKILATATDTMAPAQTMANT